MGVFLNVWNDMGWEPPNFRVLGDEEGLITAVGLLANISKAQSISGDTNESRGE